MDKLFDIGDTFHPDFYLRTNFDKNKEQIYLKAIAEFKKQTGTKRLSISQNAYDCNGNLLADQYALLDSSSDDLSKFWRIKENMLNNFTKASLIITIPNPTSQKVIKEVEGGGTTYYKHPEEKRFDCYVRPLNDKDIYEILKSQGIEINFEKVNRDVLNAILHKMTYIENVNIAYGHEKFIDGEFYEYWLFRKI